MFNILRKNKNGIVINILDEMIKNKAKELCIMELAINNGVDMIAKTLAKCEIKSYRKGNDGTLRVIKDDNHYMLNVKPNANEEGFEFWRKVYHKLLTENEALLIRTLSNDLLLASSFTSGDEVIRARTYSNVIVECSGKYKSLNKIYESDEVIYLKNTNEKAISLIKTFNTQYSEMVSASMLSYQLSNIPKLKMMVGNANLSFQKKDGTKTTLDDLVEQTKEKMNSSEIEVLLSQQGIDYSLLQSTSKNTDDFVKMIETSLMIVSLCLDIPYDVLVGKTTEKSNAMNDFIAFSIETYKRITEDALNSTFLTKNQYKEGELFRIDTTKIKHYDILDVANGMDKLFAQGYSHNDVREFTDQLPIDEDWANERYVTKNYGKEEKGGVEKNG